MDKASKDLRRASLWKTEKLKRYFCVPQHKEQQPTQNNAFSKSALHDEMKSTSNEPEGAGQADCALEGVREAGVSK